MGSSSGVGSIHDYSFKILIIGDSGVGKSSLLISFISNHVDDLSPTIGKAIVAVSLASGFFLKLPIRLGFGDSEFRFAILVNSGLVYLVVLAFCERIRWLIE